MSSQRRQPDSRTPATGLAAAGVPNESVAERPSGLLRPGIPHPRGQRLRWVLAPAVSAVIAFVAVYGQVARPTVAAANVAASVAAAEADGEAALASSKADLVNLARPRPEDIRDAELAVEAAKNALWSAQTGRDLICGSRRPTSCDSVNASVSASEAMVSVAETKLARLRAGPRIEEVAAAEASAAAAEARVASAQALLAGARTGQTGGSLGTAAKARAAEAALAAARAEALSARSDLVKLKVPRTEDVRAAELQADSARHAVLAARLSRDLVCSGNSQTQCDNARASFAAAETGLSRAANELARVKAGGRAEEIAAAEKAVASADAHVAKVEVLASAGSALSADEFLLTQVALDQPAGRLTESFLALLRGR